MKYSELIWLRWCCWHNRGCKSKFTKQIHKEDGDSQFCQGWQWNEINSDCKKMFQCSVVEDFFLIVKVGKC